METHKKTFFFFFFFGRTIGNFETFFNFRIVSGGKSAPFGVRRKKIGTCLLTEQMFSDQKKTPQVKKKKNIIHTVMTTISSRFRR